jgi:MGT family glycosyltransferase
MEKRHIAFFIAPAHGHINPTLAIASGLAARGHRVTYAMPERFAPELRGIGADVITYNVPLIPEGFASEEERTKKEKDITVDIDELHKCHGFFWNNRPDLIIYDYLDISGALFSKKMPDIPAIKCFPSFAHNESFPFSRGGWPADDDLIEKSKKEWDELLSTDGIGDYFYDHISSCNIVFIPRFFQYRNDTFDERFHFVGPSISERTFYGRWHQPRKHQNTVLISLGTVLNAQVDFFKGCISAFKNLDVHVVMSVGKGVDISLLEPIPSNFEVHSFVSHIDILPNANVYVGHGGMNSTMEALYFGVPLLLAPQDGHQTLIAERVSELGLGEILPKPFHHPGTLKQYLLALIKNTKLRRRVKHVGVKMRATNSRDVLIEIIEMHFRGQ